MAVFGQCDNAVHCVRDLQYSLEISEIRNLDLKIGLSVGEPVTEKGDVFFGSTIKLAERLCRLAPVGETLASFQIRKLYQGDLSAISKLQPLNFTDPKEEKFLNQLMQVTEEKLNENEFSVENLGKELGISRPQLYRKIKALTGFPPKDLIRDLRLTEAAKLLKNYTGNISEIAYEVGFNHPSHFAKCFKKRFGMLPSEAGKMVSLSA